MISFEQPSRWVQLRLKENIRNGKLLEDENYSASRYKNLGSLGCSAPHKERSIVLTSHSLSSSMDEHALKYRLFLSFKLYEAKGAGADPSTSFVHTPFHHCWEIWRALGILVRDLPSQRRALLIRLHIEYSQSRAPVESPPSCARARTFILNLHPARPLRALVPDLCSLARTDKQKV
jgi:hypothetical protein